MNSQHISSQHNNTIQQHNPTTQSNNTIQQHKSNNTIQQRKSNNNDDPQDFYQLFPEKFQNKTNGVTPRRWLAFCNPQLAALITETLGSDSWIKNTYELRGLAKHADDAKLQARWRAVKRANKERLAAYIKATHGADVNIDALFDIQVKRIHEYKRQLLNVLSVIWRYKELKKMSPEERKKAVPRVVCIGGKAASGERLVVVAVGCEEGGQGGARRAGRNDAAAAA